MVTTSLLFSLVKRKKTNRLLYVCKNVQKSKIFVLLHCKKYCAISCGESDLCPRNQLVATDLSDRSLCEYIKFQRKAQ